MTAFARLKPGVQLKEAQADLATIASRLEKAYPEAYPKAYGYGIQAAPLRDDLTRRARTTFLVLLGGAGLVLLIACANVANLLLARLLKVQRELAVRAALGASRSRLVRQLLTESVMLSLAGGILGLALTPWAVRLLTSFAERFTTRAAEVKIDLPVLLFTFVVSIGTGILFGLAPAFSSKDDVTSAIKDGGGRSTSSKGRQKLRSGLVVGQVAVSFMLLMAAGLMIRSFVKLLEVNPGFNPTRLLTMRVTPNFTRYRSAAESIALSHKILERVGEVPALESVSLASNFPFNPQGVLTGPSTNPLEVEGKPQAKGELAPVVDITVVSPEYFGTIRQLLLDGRNFSGHDDTKAPLVGIINQTMARHRWRNENAIGKRVSIDGGRSWTKIIGIVADTKEYGLSRPMADELYISVDQAGFPGNLVVRTPLDSAAASPLIQKVLHGIDPQLAVDRVATVDHLEQEWVASPRIVTILLGLFATLALVISATGTAAVMALSVSQRTREVGVRMALGASHHSIVRMIVQQGLRLTLAGTVLGISGAVMLTPLLSSLLYATRPNDAVTYTAVLLIFLIVGLVACFLPARQVTSIDPVIALRQE
jgi:predicted permease